MSRLLALAVCCALPLAVSAGRGEGTLPVLSPPIDLPLQLSGTLGEVRGFSLHSGIDIKTRGRTGFAVRAPADGTVVRMLSGETGYGNALFLDHGGLIQTVYGHLDSFDDGLLPLQRIALIAKLLQNSRSVDIPFASALFSLKKGALLGYNGESGSGTPHLHYEVRGGGNYLNPLALYTVPDRTAPVIERLYVCAGMGSSTIAEKELHLKKSRGAYVPEERTVVFSTPDKIFFKLSCFDTVNALNVVSIYRITVRVDGKTAFDLAFDEMSMADPAYGQYLYDISRSTIDGSAVYTYFLCRREGNLYSGIHGETDGRISPGDAEKRVEIEVLDHAGNRSRVEFTLRAPLSIQSLDGWIKALPGRETVLTDGPGRFRLTVRPGGLGAETLMSARELPLTEIDKLSGYKRPADGAVLALYAVAPFDIVYRKPAAVMIAPPPGTNGDALAGTGIYQLFEGKKPKPLATRRSGAVFEAAARTNGCFALIRDDTPPEISLPPTHEFIQDRAPFRFMRFYINDRLSELDTASVVCAFDGEPWPVRYDPDRRWIEISLPLDAVRTGEHHVVVRCRDNAGNQASFRTVL
jgi:hypothetical protein